MGINEDLILKYLQGECTEKEIELINQWLKASPEHAEELFSMELVYKSGKFRHFNENSYLEKAKQKLDSNILREKDKSRRKETYKLFYRYAAMIAFIMICGVTSYFLIQRDQNYLTLTTHQEIEKVTLSDGTKVWLNSNTTLRYPEKFSSKKRKVFLEGEGYFEVTKNPDAPFIIDTESLETTVLGTSFNLNSTKECKFSTVTLTEGKVKLKSYKNDKELTLSPGQKARLNKESGDLYIAEDSIRVPILWHKGLIPFNQATIKEIAYTLEKLYKVKIEIDEISPSSTYSGAIQKYRDIEKTLKSLQNTLPIIYEVKEEAIHIKVD